ncbi:hypothetical protein ACEPAG_8901 [Sanghuangporus baumii]
MDSLLTWICTRPVAAAFVLYLALVRLLRFQRVRALKKKYGYGPSLNTIAPTALTDLTETHSLTKPSVRHSSPRVAGRPDETARAGEAERAEKTEKGKQGRAKARRELPGLTRIANAFNLFKTYSIPTISEILLKSKQLSTAENVSRRYADTAVLIETWTGCPIADLTRTNLKKEGADPRHAIAIARVNWLHSRWPNIKNDDFIYTMSQFVLESIRWARLYGWRELLPIEQEALFVFWKEIGHRMKIRDLPETLQDLIDWTEKYEETDMVPAQCNYEVGKHTLDYIVSDFTEWFGVRKIMRQISLCLLEPRVRTVLLLPEPSLMAQAMTSVVMSFFAIKARYFDLPRFKRVEYIPRHVPPQKLKEKLPRFHPTMFDKVPWYKPEPKGIGRIWQNILLQIGYLDEQDIPSSKYKSAGYRLEECGPVVLEQVGHAEVMKMAAEIQGCPVTGIWAR